MRYRFIDNNGTFELDNADANSYLYFPLCNEAGLMGSVTPLLGGDLMLDQNHFILQPTSVSDLHNNKSTRNFWLRFDDGGLRSATGVSVWQRAARFGCRNARGVKLRAGLLWQETVNDICYGSACIEASVLSFVPTDRTMAQMMRVTLTNKGENEAVFEPIAVIPMYGRSATNLRDHRHVTSLLHRISTEKYGVRIKPTLSFDERGHLKNHTEYFTLGCDGEGVAPVAFLPTSDMVIGEGGDYECPLGLMKTAWTQTRSDDNCCKDTGNRENVEFGVPAGRTFEGVEAAGGLIFEKKTLKPGETAEYLIFIGAREDDDELNSAEAIIERLGSHAKTEAALKANTEFWLAKAKAGLGAGKTANTGKAAYEDTDDLPRSGNKGETVNRIPDGFESKDRQNFMLWVAAEPVLRRIFGCSFLPYHDYGKGGRGWRDLWQDCLALMLANPADVRDLLINNFAGVRADGTNATIIGSKPGEFIADRNGIARVWMDHGVWPWITMQLYIELSGDAEVLATQQVYFKDRLCKRARDVDDEEYCCPGNGANAGGNKESSAGARTLLRDVNGEIYKGTVLEHILMMHITAACDVGEHGNMLLRGADWNDALDMADKKGESVAFTAAYAGNLRSLAECVKAKPGKQMILKELAELIDGLYAIYADEQDHEDRREHGEGQDYKDSKKHEASSNAMPHDNRKGTKAELIKGIAARKRDILDSYCEKVRHTVSGEKTGIDNAELAQKLEAIAGSIMKHIRENEMISDGELAWFNGYYDNESLPVESLEKGHLMLTGAVFTLMSGTATDEMIDRMIKTADRYLLREEIGGYRLNTRFDNEESYAHKLGRMFGFAYGTKENGAVFCHMAVMYAYALLMRGRKEAAAKVIDLLIGQSMDFGKAHIYPGIPEYFDSNGRGMYPYLTGAASWLLLYYYRLRTV